MAFKSSAQRKFEAIQANNEQIAQQDYAGMTRTSAGWVGTGNASNQLLAGSPILKAGGLGSNILDVAAAEPVPKTTGQEILKQAGQWTPLNTYYGLNGKNAIGKGIAAAFELGAKQRSDLESVNKQTTPGQTSAAGLGTGTVTAATEPKTYNVNGQQMTLGEYIRSLGVQSPNDTYKASVQNANAAYDRQRATYGAEAEALAGQGLGHSGTSDYLDSQAYAEKQRAISLAADSRDQQMATYATGYSTYLQQEQAERQAQIESALERAVSMQLNTDNTVKYLMAMTGMTRSEAMRYAEAGSALTSATAEDTTKATLQEIRNAYALLTSTNTEKGGQGMSSDAARKYLKGSTYGYDSALVDQAVNELVGAVEQTEADNLAASQKVVAEAFDKVFDSQYTKDEATAALAEVGITLTANEEKGVFDNYATQDAIAAAYRNGMIDEAAYQSLSRKNIDDTYESLKEKGTVGDWLQMIVNYADETDTKNYAIDKIKNEMTITKSGIAKANDDLNGFVGGMSRAYFNVSINGNSALVSFRLGSVKKGVTASKDSIYSDGGKIYAYSTDGSWREIVGVETSGVGSIGTGNINKEQGDALFGTLKSYYTSNMSAAAIGGAISGAAKTKQ